MNLFGPVGGSTFLYIALGTAALAIGAYIIKMRRRRFEVPFSALWKRVLEHKDSNSLWKQLKRLLSLLLILLILGIVLFAALDPTLGSESREARNVVILIDASASMKAMDGDEDGRISRMEAAKKKAGEVIDSMGGGDFAMVMRVDGQATPLSRFSADAPMLRKVIFGGSTEAKAAGTTVNGKLVKEDEKKFEGIQASDTPADLPRALGAAADALRDRPNPLIILISDGAYPEAQLGQVSWDPANPVAPPVAPKIGPSTTKTNGVSTQWDGKTLATVDLSKIDVRYLPVGKRSDNVGIVAFNVRRYIANKAAYEVYIEVQNFGTELAHRQLALYNGKTQVEMKKLDIPPGQRVRSIVSKLPASAESELRASLRPVEGVANGSDSFALDDTAYALLPQRKKQKVMMVTEDNLFLEAALLVLDDDIIPTKLTPAAYDADPSVAEKVDVVIFDEHTPKELPPPPVNLLFFHPTGDKSPFVIRGEVSSPRITETDEGHPIMRWVQMSDVYTDKTAVFAIDNKKGESAVAYYVRDAMIATKRESRRKIVAFGFSLPSEGRESATDLPMRVAFPMLLVNTLDWFAGDTTDLLTTYPTGKRERIPLDGVVGATEAEIVGPDGVMTKAPVLDNLASFYGNRVGFYEVAAKNATGKTLSTISLAANLASASESDIAPSAELSLGGKKLEAPEPFSPSTSRKIWVYLLFLAMGLIVMEWVTYHRRITV